MSNCNHLTGIFKIIMIIDHVKSDQLLFSRMELSTKENGSLKKAKRMAEVFKSGQMVPGMTASGEMAWPMAMVDLFMLKEMCMKENGPKIKPMASEFTLTTMEVDTKDNGSKISNTDTVLNNGQMVLSTKVNMNKV